LPHDGRLPRRWSGACRCGTIARSSPQAGLSWQIILRKREAFLRAFEVSDPEKLARFDTQKIASLMAEPGIVRNRAKEGTPARAPPSSSPSSPGRPRGRGAGSMRSIACASPPVAEA
jgi:hypothetical protein